MSGVVEDRVDAVGAEHAVAELEHDDVGLAGWRAWSASCARAGPFVARRGHDAEVGEDRDAARAGVLHREDVAAQRDARRLAGDDVQPACDALTIARTPPPSCPRSCTSRRARRPARRACRASPPWSSAPCRRAPARRCAPRGTGSAAPRRAPRRRTAAPKSGFTVSQTPSTPPMLRMWITSPGRDLLGHVARVAEQRLPVAERAGDDVAGLPTLREAARWQLERVVGALRGEHATAITPPSSHGMSGETRTSREGGSPASPSRSCRR